VRIAYAGTPEFAVPALIALLGSPHSVVGVLTQPDRPKGRGRQLASSPVKQAAVEHGIPVSQPQSLRDATARADLTAWRPDALVVVAYGLILPQAVLDLPRLGCFNIHASLLPRWRGAAPINRAVMAGDAQSGVCVMKMAEGLDTGDVAMEERVTIGADETAGELHDRLAAVGARMMPVALGALGRGTLGLTPQPHEGVTYAEKIRKDETRIDWSKSWNAVHDHARGLSPFPGAWFELPGTQPARIKVLRTTRGEGAGAPGTVLDDKLTIACGEGSIRLLDIQRAGKQPMNAGDFLRGTAVAPGTVVL